MMHPAPKFDPEWLDTLVKVGAGFFLGLAMGLLVGCGGLQVEEGFSPKEGTVHYDFDEATQTHHIVARGVGSMVLNIGVLEALVSAVALLDAPNERAVMTVTAGVSLDFVELLASLHLDTGLEIFEVCFDASFGRTFHFCFPLRRMEEPKHTASGEAIVD